MRNLPHWFAWHNNHPCTAGLPDSSECALTSGHNFRMSSLRNKHCPGLRAWLRMVVSASTGYMRVGKAHTDTHLPMSAIQVTIGFVGTFVGPLLVLPKLPVDSKQVSVCQLLRQAPSGWLQAKPGEVLSVATAEAARNTKRCGLVAMFSISKDKYSANNHKPEQRPTM